MASYGIGLALDDIDVMTLEPVTGEQALTLESMSGAHAMAELATSCVATCSCCITCCCCCCG
jgi:hypothetical protein